MQCGFHRISIIRAGTILLLWGLAALAAPPDLTKQTDAFDHSILNIVLEDLLSYTSPDSPVLDAGASPKTLHFDPAPAIWPRTIDAVLYQKAGVQWSDLQRENEKHIAEAASNLVARITTPTSGEPYIPANPRIQLLSEASQYTTWVRPIRAYRPGYSLDGSIAISLVVIPWGNHHADGTYILFRAEESWRIALRQFNIYP